MNRLLVTTAILINFTTTAANAIAVLLDRLSQSWAKNLQPWRYVS
jgi:hypothetical protein